MPLPVEMLILFKYSTAPFVSPTVTPRLSDAVGVAVDANLVVVVNFILDGNTNAEVDAANTNNMTSKEHGMIEQVIIILKIFVINTAREKS